ncbi:hypothetical protein FOA52_008814 [Chlamydomonas sp. UWO 241]|nr:hypothetical protein FOA52_008814 [Chlamydomonas sp. UWO 241]
MMAHAGPTCVCEEPCEEHRLYDNDRAAPRAVVGADQLHHGRLRTARHCCCHCCCCCKSNRDSPISAPRK